MTRARAPSRIGGTDIRGVTQESLHDVIGVVTQDAHMFHDTIRANLGYAKPDATEAGADRGVQGGADLAAGRGAARRARHDRRRPRLPAVRRGEAADRAGQAAAEGAVGGRARRGDRAPGLRVRGRRPAGAEDRAGRADLAGDRAPAVHDHRGRPDPGHRRRQGHRAGHARRAARRRRPVHRAVPHPVRQPGAVTARHTGRGQERDWPRRTRRPAPPSPLGRRGADGAAETPAAAALEAGEARSGSAR